MDTDKKKESTAAAGESVGKIAAELREFAERAEEQYFSGAVVAGLAKMLADRLDAAILPKQLRNCDKYATAEDAKTAWSKYKTSCPTPPGGWNVDDLLDWFFAPATEQKGDLDGNK